MATCVGPAPAWACRLPASRPQCIRCAGASVIGCARPETGSGALASLLWLVEADPKKLPGGKGLFSLAATDSFCWWMGVWVDGTGTTGSTGNVWWNIATIWEYFLYISMPSYTKNLSITHSLTWAEELFEITHTKKSNCTPTIDNLLSFHINQPTKRNLNVLFMLPAKETGVDEPQSHCATVNNTKLMNRLSSVPATGEARTYWLPL